MEFKTNIVLKVQIFHFLFTEVLHWLLRNYSDIFRGSKLTGQWTDYMYMYIHINIYIIVLYNVTKYPTAIQITSNLT